MTFTVGNATETLVMEKTYDAGATLSSTRLVAIDISIPTCRALLTAQYGADVTLRSITVRASERSLTYFVEPQAPTDTFAFRNVFNVMEPVPLHCITTEKTDVSRSLAVCNSTASFYDQSTAVTYEVETAPLTPEEAHWLGQMLSSYEVRHSPSAADYADALDTLPRVLITDMTAEVHNGDSELNTLKFTYRYEDERPLLILSDNSDIFTDQFSDPYA
jgi:hypothetical protein